MSDISKGQTTAANQVTKAGAAAYVDDGSTLARMNALLAKLDRASELEKTPEQIEAEQIAATREAKRAEAVAAAKRLNQRIPPERGAEQDFWTVVLADTAPPGCLEFTTHLAGIELENPKDGTWLIVSLINGLNWIPASHFSGEWPAVCKTLHHMVEHRAVTVYPPGAKVPATLLTTHAKGLRSLAVMYNDKEAPQVKKLLAQAERVEQMAA